MTQGTRIIEMGYFSDLAIEILERRLRTKRIDGKNVCSSCFDDEHISKFIKDRAAGSSCHYCGDEGSHVHAAPLEDVLEFMLPQIELEYACADQSLPDDPDTGERMFPEDEFDTREMLELYVELELPNDHKGKLMEDIAASLPEQDWCLTDPLTTRRDEAIGNSWEHFKTVIKHRRRFFFLQHKDRALQDDVSLGEAAYDVPELLGQIADFAKRHGLVAKLDKGSRWVRCQAMAPDEHDFSAQRMGPPPYEHATMPNRMSPAGVPMFYGAIDTETALAEIATAPGKFAAATFETLRDVMILDVSSIPEVPSLFDPTHARDRPIAKFMQAFVEDFREPIDRELRAHMDYLPTQVVTEYFRTMVLDGDQMPIEGVRYASTKNGGLAIVLFAENEDVAAAGNEDTDAAPWLRMIAYEEVQHVAIAN